MPAYKDKERNTWYCSFYYTDWTGARKLKKKRGFPTKREASAWEAEFLRTQARSCDMTFGSMAEIYMADMENRLRKNTMQTKRNIIDQKVLPYFKDRKINEITAADVRSWQSVILAQGVAPTYAKTIHNQLSAILNYSVKYYKLQTNPAKEAGSMGKSKATEMKFWTVDEFNTFIPHVSKLPARVGFSIMFWAGLRISELLALDISDIKIASSEISINKSFQVIDGEEVIDEPKTPRSKRVLPIPQKLCKEIEEYINALYEPEPGDRLFPYTKSYFHHQIESGCRKAGMEKIRLHDLRHSHAALLIHLKEPILLVSQRMGHEDVETTLRIYGHLYPTSEETVISKMDDLMK